MILLISLWYFPGTVLVILLQPPVNCWRTWPELLITIITSRKQWTYHPSFIIVRYLLNVAIPHPPERFIAPETVFFFSLVVAIAYLHVGTTFCPPPIQSSHLRLADAIDHYPQPNWSHHIVVWCVVNVQGCTKQSQMHTLPRKIALPGTEFNKVMQVRTLSSAQHPTPHNKLL